LKPTTNSSKKSNGRVSKGSELQPPQQQPRKKSDGDIWKVKSNGNDNTSKNGAKSSSSQEFCAYYKSGGCRYGKSCYYRHPEEPKKFTKEVSKQGVNKEKKPLKKVCESWKRMGCCNFGYECPLLHSGAYENKVPERDKSHDCRRMREKGYCEYGSQCWYRHDHIPKFNETSAKTYQESEQAEELEKQKKDIAISSEKQKEQKENEVQQTEETEAKESLERKGTKEGTTVEEKDSGTELTQDNSNSKVPETSELEQEKEVLFSASIPLEPKQQTAATNLQEPLLALPVDFFQGQFNSWNKSPLTMGRPLFPLPEKTTAGNSPTTTTTSRVPSAADNDNDKEFSSKDRPFSFMKLVQQYSGQESLYQNFQFDQPIQKPSLEVQEAWPNEQVSTESNHDMTVSTQNQTTDLSSTGDYQPTPIVQGYNDSPVPIHNIEPIPNPQSFSHFIQKPIFHVSSSSSTSSLGPSQPASQPASQPVQPAQRERACDACKKVFEIHSLNQCGACFQTYYCSKSCQIAHWPVHEQNCKKHYG